MSAIPSLYWRSLNYGAVDPDLVPNDSVMWSQVQKHMLGAGLLNVKKNASDVNGHTQDTIVAVTFLKPKKYSYVFVIMGAGNSALTLCDKVYNKLKGVKFL